MKHHDSDDGHGYTDTQSQYNICLPVRASFLDFYPVVLVLVYSTTLCPDFF